MSTTAPFIRRARLFVGPLSEDQGGGPRDQAILIDSDGSREQLKVTFSIVKTLLGAPNSSTIEVYNVPRNTRNRIQGTLSRVQLLVGYQNTELTLLASGALQSVQHVKEGTDIITRMTILDGYGGMTKGLVNQTFAGRATVSDTVRTIAGRMPGVSVGRIDVDGSLGSGGATFSERASEALDKLADQYGFSWSVQDGIFQALSDRRTFNRSTVLSNENRNLLSVYPILAGPMQIETGAAISAILDARIRPGDNVDVTSANNPSLNGNWKVHNVDYQGDTFSTGWVMNIQSFKVF